MGIVKLAAENANQNDKLQLIEAYDRLKQLEAHVDTDAAIDAYLEADYDLHKLIASFTRNTLRGTHTLRIGLEANATKNLAFRLGYNLSTSAYKKDISFDQYNINSAAMDYATSTSYMRLGATNILTLGMGYRWKSFYIDLAYKLRNQFADFYAFDTSFTNTNQEYVPQFVLDNPLLADVTIDPVEVNLTRHAITCTLGFKF